MNLLGRVRLVRSNLPCEEDWSAMVEGSRGRRMLDLLDQDGKMSPNCFVYDIFVKSRTQIVGSDTYVNLNFDFGTLMKIFDLMESYAKLWIFS